MSTPFWIEKAEFDSGHCVLVGDFVLHCEGDDRERTLLNVFSCHKLVEGPEREIVKRWFAANPDAVREAYNEEYRRLCPEDEIAAIRADDRHDQRMNAGGW